MITESKFKLYKTTEGILILDIDTIMVGDSNKIDICNNTNYPNTYYLEDNVDGSFNIVEREDMVTDIRYKIIITKNPLKIKEKEYDSKLIEAGSSTIREFLELHDLPNINIGDVNPKEHGALLVDINHSDYYYTQEINKSPDVEAYIYLESMVPLEDVGDYSNLINIDLERYRTEIYVSSKFDEDLLFFNEL